MVLLWLFGVNDGARCLVGPDGKRRRCYLNRPNWLRERLQCVPTATDGVPQARDHNTAYVKMLCKVAPGGMFSGPLHHWEGYDECELQRDRLWGATDALSVSVQRAWVLQEPLCLSRISHFRKGVDLPHSNYLKVRYGLVRPLFDQQLREDLLLRGAHDQQATLLETLRSDMGVAASVVATQDIMALAVPLDVLRLLQHGYWRHLLVLGRWFTSPCLTPSSLLCNGRPRPQWMLPAGWFSAWPRI